MPAGITHLKPSAKGSAELLCSPDSPLASVHAPQGKHQATSDSKMAAKNSSAILAGLWWLMSAEVPEESTVHVWLDTGSQYQEPILHFLCCFL